MIIIVLFLFICLIFAMLTASAGLMTLSGACVRQMSVPIQASPQRHDPEYTSAVAEVNRLVDETPDNMVDLYPES